MDQIRLNALDADDLAIVSAHCQDAVLRAGDLRLDGRAGRLLVPMNRFAWETAKPRRWFARPEPGERRRSVLRLDRVLSASRTGIDPGAPEEILSLMALRWHEGEAPSGSIELVFAGEAAIRLQVECIEVQLTDLGASWSTPSRPAHPV
ncbi:DUF2948 family protein [Aureimonas flava]|uniref:DUF2948 family protein n=1 Tax=Aureimonas flava TaxID=2320271 RepID=A0A3A1WSP6_9HYPH|nr:DUF2948 family protein [Aureimonas flava]RIY00725.1 DUF2948 family protein [Aureimonas flava]